MKRKEAYLSKERIDSLFRVDLEAGSLYWAVNKGSRARKGQFAGTFVRGYNAVMVDGYLYKVHRIIQFYKTGEWPIEVDHIDRNPTDNSKIRSVTSSQNRFNRETPRGKDSQFRGVRLSKNKINWEARIQVQGTQIHLGSFQTESAAAEARRTAEIKYFGEHAI